ncbi:MAG: hypothetical protein AAFV43_10875 [Planctomycetota bacterium]
MIDGRVWRAATCGVVLALVVLVAESLAAAWPALEPLNERRLERFGLRVVASGHAEMITDMPSSAAIDELPPMIDAAVPQLAERFGVGESRWKPWRVRLCLIDDEARFAAAGLMPEGERRFANGLSLGYRCWVRDQPSDYYRRHLVLHEATHGFMQTLLGGCGPGWYMEGVAELCGTHAWRGRTLTLAAMPASKQASPMWGRVRSIQDAVAAGETKPVAAVRLLDNRRPMSADQYAWVWALAKLLDTHPAYQQRFRALSEHVTAADFDARFDRSFARDREQLEQEWRLFVDTIEYGHDPVREAIDFEPGEALPPGAERTAAERTATVRAATVRADRGWQSSGVRVAAGEAYRLTATGRYTIAHEPDGAPWPCEPGGVTLDYHRGRPLGELQAAVDAGADAFLRATPVGLAATFRPERAGTLYLRVNDRPNALAENEGTLRVAIRRE